MDGPRRGLLKICYCETSRTFYDISILRSGSGGWQCGEHRVLLLLTRADQPRALQQPLVQAVRRLALTIQTSNIFVQKIKYFCYDSWIFFCKYMAAAAGNNAAKYADLDKVDTWWVGAGQKQGRQSSNGCMGVHRK